MEGVHGALVFRAARRDESRAAIRATNAAAVVIGSVSTFHAMDNAKVTALPLTSWARRRQRLCRRRSRLCADRPLALAPFTITDGNVQVR